MNISMPYIILYVTDHDKSITFYRDTLGLPIKGEHGTYVEFDTGSTILAINTRESVRSLTDLPITDSTSQTQTFELAFVVDDVATKIEELRSLNVPIIVEPTVKPWGQTVAYIQDPDNHYIEICSSLE